MPKGVYDRSGMVFSGRGRRKREYIDLVLTKREFNILRRGNRTVKPLNGTGKWLSIRMEDKSIERRIAKLQKQINSLRIKITN